MNINPSISSLFENFNNAQQENNFELAYSILQQAHQLLEKIPQTNILWAFYYINRASYFNNTGQFLESIDSSKKAENIIPYRKNDDLRAKIESSRAVSYLNIGQYDDSFESVNNAISLYKKLNITEKLALELITCGEILLRKGNWDQAIKNYSEALLIAKKNNDKLLEARTLMALGFVFRGHRFLYLAIDHFREAERIFKGINFNPGLADALYERANTYVSLKMAEETFALIKQIEGITPPDSVKRSFLYNLQYCLHNQNMEFGEAMNCASLLLDFFRKAHDKLGEAESLEKIASVYYNLSDMEQAKAYGMKALNMSKEIGDQILQDICIQLFQDIDNAIANKAVRHEF